MIYYLMARIINGVFLFRKSPKLGHGGTEYIAQVLGCDPKTIRQGRGDLSQGLELAPGKVRRAGGGRKKIRALQSDLDEAFKEILQEETAGEPMHGEVRWTHLTKQQIADRLAQAGFRVSRNIVKQLLKAHGYVKRKAQKAQAMGQNPARNAQFENIAEIKQQYLDSANPILSMDTKKKELLGNFYREGKLYTREVIKTFDHDFSSAASGVVIPHGLWDLKRNEGYLHLGTSHDTGEFACDNLYRWWCNHGRAQYPEASSLLLLCDGGGSNNATHYLFKEDLQKLANRIGLEIRIAHYPPYTSKYNPIEHRLFPHVTRACQGVVFETLDIVQALMAKTKTKTGLKVFVDVVDQFYQTGRKYAADFKENMTIVFDEHLPKWNYTAVPCGT